eukprot:XP_001702209.1 predicted protein [Chlamydomonas reinhardtii]
MTRTRYVLRHGLWGSPADTSYLATYLRHQGYAVLNAAANTARCTFDGADVCGDRLAAEVVAALHQLAAAGTPATSLSFAAYSFGGLIARYAAGKLLAAGLLRAGSGSGSGGCFGEQQEQHPHQNGASTETGAGAMWPTATPPGALVAAASGLRPLRAANFLTIASPHLGCWEEPASLTHQANHWLDPQAAAGARGSGGGSGGGGGLPLLAVMADPTCVFHAALALFDKRVLLADIRLDRTVPYCTAAISRHNPYSPQGADSSGSGISSTNARIPGRAAGSTAVSDHCVDDCAEADTEPAGGPLAAAVNWHWQPSYTAARVGALGGSGFGSGVFRGGTGADDALGGGGSGGGLLSASPRLRLGLFLALLPVLLALWGCMVAWLAGCWLHHVALLLAVRPDRGWDVRLPTSAASGLPVPPKTEGWEEEQEQRPHTSQVDQQPTGPAYMGHQASSEDVAHQDVGGTAAAGGMDALRAQDLAGPAVVRAVVATAVGNVLRRHGEGPQGAPHGSAVAAAAHAPRDTAALLDNMITHLNMLKWQKVDVDTGHYAAHAAIVVRSSRRFGRSHGHIIEYALRQLRP